MNEVERIIAKMRKIYNVKPKGKGHVVKCFNFMEAAGWDTEKEDAAKGEKIARRRSKASK